MTQFYPEVGPRGALRLITDLLSLAWVALWWRVGVAVHASVLTLQQAGYGVRDAGTTINSVLSSIRDHIPTNAPLVGSYLRDEAEALRRQSGDRLVADGAHLNTDIDHLATLLGVLVAVLPILYGLWVYGRMRWHEVGEMSAARALVAAAHRSDHGAELEHLLAQRAATTLSMRELMRASRDPVGDLAVDRRRPLAVAALRSVGLSERRLESPAAVREP